MTTPTKSNPEHWGPVWAFFGAILLTVSTVVLLHLVIGRNEPNDSWFGLVYLFVPIFGVPLGAFVGKLLHFWRSLLRCRRSQRPSPSTVTSESRMYVYGALGVLPAVAAVTGLFYSHAKHSGVAWAGLVAGVVFIAAVGAVLYTLISRRLWALAVALCVASYLVFGFAADASNEASERRAQDYRERVVGAVDALALPETSDYWRISHMEFRLFQEEATTTVVLQSSDGDWVEVRSFSRPLADWCESEPFRGTCRDIQVDRSDMQVTAGLGAELARYEVTVGAQEFVIASQTELSPATFRSLIDVLDLVDVDEWLAAYQSSL